MILGRLAKWDSALHPESEEFCSNPIDALGQALEPNFVTRLPVTLVMNEE